MLKLDISGIHFEVDQDIRKYTDKKIGKLDKYMGSHAKESAHAEVKLKKQKSKTKNQFTAEVVLFLPHEQVTIKESTINMYAAIDIVEDKLKTVLKKNKEKSTDRYESRLRILSKLRKLARK